MSTENDRVDRIQAEWRRERPDVDPSPQGVIGRLHRLADALHDRVDAVLGEHGLSRAEFDVLASLRRAGPGYARAAGELADHTMVTSGGLTKRVDRLVARGLVSRTAGDADGRVRTVSLTADGARVVDAAFTDHMRNEHALIAPLGERSDELAELLAAWLRALGED